MSELNLAQVREFVSSVCEGGRSIALLVEEGFSSAMKGVIRAVNDCIGFINHHDEYHADHGEVDFPPLPPVWIVGEEGVGKRSLSQRLHQGCAHRQPFLDLDCRKADPASIASVPFGDGPIDSQGIIPGGQGMFWDADGGILVIREPSMLLGTSGTGLLSGSVRAGCAESGRMERSGEPTWYWF